MGEILTEKLSESAPSWLGEFLNAKDLPYHQRYFQNSIKHNCPVALSTAHFQQGTPRNGSDPLFTSSRYVTFVQLRTDYPVAGSWLVG